MDCRQLLDARLQTLIRELYYVRVDLDRMKDERLKARLKLRFNNLSNELIKQSEELRKRVAATSEDRVLAEHWARFLGRRDRINELIAECLDFRVGELTRQAGLDQGLCAVADSLLDSFSATAEVYWNRLSLLDNAESFRGLSQIVRVRFPASIWDLPLVAHEYGHFLCLQLDKKDFYGNSTFPFQDLLKRESGDDTFTEREENHLKELFCDAFATYALGPAFAYTQVYRRFDPAQRTEGSYTHPGDDARVRLILKVLEKVDATRNRFSRQYTGVIADLRQTWTSWREGAAAGSAEYLKRIDLWTDELYDILEPQLEALRFDDWNRADTLADRFTALGRTDVDMVPDPDDTIPRILNALWHYRLSYPDSPFEGLEHIGNQALKMCVRLVS
jgi:hypothetical protein